VFATCQRSIFEVIERHLLAASGGIEVTPVSTSPSALSQSEFALEIHLEEFIDKNWNRIDFGRKLKRYTSEDENGRQFPAGQWSIDFLCADEISGNLVVVELKKGQTSDATVGQILRYIAWVEENIADEGQRVDGIVVATDVDDALRYAVKNQPHIQVLTYRVDFALQKATPAKS